MSGRKNYSVSVNVDSRLHKHLETLPNVSKFFIKAALHYIDDRIALEQIVQSIESLSEKIDKIKISAPRHNAIKGIEKPPKLSRGKR